MDLQNNREIARMTEELQQNAAAGKYEVSDLILRKDGAEYQFVDLVMEGGGTLGIALVGYIYALEQANIRFLSIGGSSVGAIVSLLLAAGGEHSQAKGGQIAEIVSSMDMSAFIDGGPVAAALSRRLGSGKAGAHMLSTVLLCFLSGGLRSKLGLNPGDAFLDWLRTQLSSFGVETCAEAQKLIQTLPPGLYHRLQGTDFARPEPALKIVAADITTGSKVVFPEMAPLYWEEPQKVNPALFARASMSIPFFFRPMQVDGICKIVSRDKHWRDLCSFEGEIPDQIAFSDGGLLSNFPISLFHQDRVPNAPTFGARLGSAARQVREIDSLGGYCTGLFSALRRYGDYDFIYHNPDYRRLIAYIPTEGHNWLNFYMSDEEKLELFQKGMEAACSFLETFDWQAYKDVRRRHLGLR